MTAASKPMLLLAARLPGLLLCVAVAAAATLLAQGEASAFGAVWLEPLVLAILVGTAVRTAWTPSARWAPGVRFGAKTLLEVAVLLLGLSISAGALRAAGLPLLLGIAATVAVALGAGYVLARTLRLPHRMALLLACGNAICGNSAIAAVAPVIGADGDDVAASIAFTAALGVVVVLTLPVLAAALHMTPLRYGVLSGLTVYAVPQVLAAAAPLGPVAIQVGTMVKLVRVLMLGPVVLCLSLLSRARGGSASAGQVVPWFILGFIALAALRSTGLVPAPVLGVASAAANGLTVVAMAALGLGTDLRTVAGAGPRVVAAAVLSLLTLGAISVWLIHLLAIG